MGTAKRNKFRGETAPDLVLETAEAAPEVKPAEKEIPKPEHPNSGKAGRNRTRQEKKKEVKSVVKESTPETPDRRSDIEDGAPETDFATRWEKIVAFYRNEKTQKITGLVLILCAAYLAIALTSYFFSWQVDQDKVLGSASDLFAPETKVKNWLGKFGAVVSHWFMYKGFGASSFVLVPVLALAGVRRLVQKQLASPSAFNAKWLFLMVWSSLTLGFIFSEDLLFMGGGFGYFIDAWIMNYVGTPGFIALLAFSMLCFLVIVMNISFRMPARETVSAATEAEAPPAGEATSGNTFRVPGSAEEEMLTEEEQAMMLDFEVTTIETAEESMASKEDLGALPQDLALTDQPVAGGPGHETAQPEQPKGEPVLEITAPVSETLIPEEENKAAQLVEEFGEYDPTLDLGSYKFPDFELLNDYGSIQSKVNQEELIANKNRILSTLKNYGIEIEKIMATVGPTVTLYEIVPAAGVRISKIKNLEDDIALSLAALGIRIIAPIPGKGTIGIEVPNQTPEMVPMRNILASEKFNNSAFELPIALGKTISNEIFIADLSKMPHLLMAGATGQGKSVGLNAVLVSLLYKKHPSQVKFVLVDPKKVELTLFNKIERHFLAKLPNSEDAIITDNTKVIHTLNSLCIEMDNRYALLQDAHVRNIKEYNAKFVQRKLNPNDGHKFLPYIILVVDEFADLIMTAGKEVETPIARLAQLARAVGIHLIIATQRPSVNIITGTIKANFPARIAFRVTSKIDSRTILDAGGAEQLIGRGDMLLSTGNDLIRIQCAFVDTPEVEKITEFIGAQRAYPSAFMLPEYVGEEGDSGREEVDLSQRDKMFDDAAKLVVQFQQGSASFLQRKLKLGYNRAGRIVDQLEAAGLIGPFEGSKAREVLCKDMQQLEEILQKIKG
jgi:DNA segregation ATPase FtsK/SpoIIIE, S-DNA-T family